MNTFFYIFLFIFWTLFWSFSSVLIYRLKSNEWWILNWRSHCNNCWSILRALELIPIFSWIKNKWKCYYCKTKVSNIYPILEISTWILFSLIWYFLIDFNLIINLDYIEIVKLFFWLFIWFISIIYTFYDILFLEINDTIMLSWIIVILVILWIQTIFPSINIINTIHNWITDLSIWIYSIILSLIIIWWLYIIMLKELKEILDIFIIILLILLIVWFKYIFNINLSDFAIINWTIWALAIFIFFFLQIIISKWAWLGWWDLRIAIFIWLILWISYSFTWVMITYFVWSIIWISLIIWSKIRYWLKTKFNSIIPFWPFLAIWFFINIFLQIEVSKLIEIYF